MNRNGLGKLYDERFRLGVEAHSRGDERGSRRLIESCPRRSYTMNDAPFVDRWGTSREVTFAVSMTLVEHLSKLRMAKAVRAALPYGRTVFRMEADLAYLDGYEAGSRHAWRKAGIGGDPPRPGGPPGEDGELPEGGAFDEAAGEAPEGLGERIERADILPEVLDRLERGVERFEPERPAGMPSFSDAPIGYGASDRFSRGRHKS